MLKELILMLLVINAFPNGAISSNADASLDDFPDDPRMHIVLPDGGHDIHIPSGHCNKPTTSNTDKLKYEFFPNSTKVGFAFVGVWLGFILIAKIMYTSSDQYRTTNKYDLVLFKPPNKASASSAIGPRRIYSNNNANVHNINAAAASGIDFSVLNVRNAISNHNHGESSSSVPSCAVPTTGISMGKMAI